MKYGLTIFPTDYSIHPAELARAFVEHQEVVFEDFDAVETRFGDGA